MGLSPKFVGHSRAEIKETVYKFALPVRDYVQVNPCIGT